MLVNVKVTGGLTFIIKILFKASVKGKVSDLRRSKPAVVPRLGSYLRIN